MFMNYIHKTYTHYHRSHSDIDLSLHDENVRSNKVTSVERSICEIMQGLCIPVGISWHLIDEVYVPINCKGSFHWVLEVVGLKKRCIRVYESLKAYAEYLSDRHQISSSNFDPEKHRTRYASLLWDYGVNKACNGYFSDNQDPPRPKRIFILSEDTKMIDVEP
ncbi:hypothetical protein FXO37_15938 [Capsicum annuum]|nr:hypothetical protein FXO37_15938 [Capsicum annuum]